MPKNLSSFTNKYKLYIKDYTSKNNILFSNLYNYVESKINSNQKIDVLLNEYIDVFNNTIINNSNEGLLNQIINEINNNFKNISYYMNNFNNNINLLKDEYYNNYYLKSNSSFLEYPEEIVYKINQFLEELIDNCKYIKDIIEINFQNRIENIVQSTNKYIYNFIKNHFNYIFKNINSNKIINNYYLPLYNKLNETYNYCIINLKNSSSNINIREILLIYLEEYEQQIQYIMNNTKNFIFYLEDIINQNFIYENCSQDLGNFTDFEENNITNNSKLECQKEKKQFDKNFSKYNFNIIKLREGIIYSKKLLENIDNLYNNYNLNNLVNINKIIYNDEILNDKNIINIYNESNKKLIDINKESLNIIEEYFQLFIDDFKNKYSYKNDYINLLKKFSKIIRFEDDDYNNNISYSSNEILDFINLQLKDFNESLFKQLSLKDNYEFFNINETCFKEKQKYFYEKIHSIL